MLRSHLDNAFVLLQGRNHALTFDDIVAVGLLDVDILARLTGHDGRDGVPVIRSANYERIDRLIIDQLSEVALSARL